MENRATSFVAGNWTHCPEIGPTKRSAIFVVTQVKKVLSGCQLYTCFLNTGATLSVEFQPIGGLLRYKIHVYVFCGRKVGHILHGLFGSPVTKPPAFSFELLIL